MARYLMIDFGSTFTKLTAVDTDTSIAEAVELAPDHKIQIGDTVFMEDGISVFSKTAK